MHADMTEFARRQERFRAMMIGLALGDARPAADGQTWLAGAATDLAMRQLHALIRSWRSPNGRSESTLIEATKRDLESYVYNTDDPTSVQLDPRPWFARNELFWKRRGNPRATVQAVNDGLEILNGTSKGVHGMVRVAPLMALWLNPTADDMQHMVPLSASLTHDLQYVGEPALLCCTLLARLATSPSSERQDVIVKTFGEAPVTAVDEFFTTAGGDFDPDHLRKVAPNGHAHRLLAGAMYLATLDIDLPTAIGCAGHATDSDGLAALAGAMIGAATGVTPWMAERFAKHEYAWQLEVLMRDLFVVGLTADEALPELAQRYPGS